MATNRRSYPNDYFAWYNDDDSLAIVWRSLVADDSSGTTAGELATNDSDSVDDGLRITYHGHYAPIGSDPTQAMNTTGLPPSLMPVLTCYIKSRLYEDLGDFQKALYFKEMFLRKVSKHPSRKSGVRALSVPRL